jgi:hypothetical protein
MAASICDVRFTLNSGHSLRQIGMSALGPEADSRTAEKQRAISPSDHREVGRRPAEWGVITCTTLQRAWP